MEKLACQLRPGDQITINGRTETVTSTELSPAGGCFVATDARSEEDAYVFDDSRKITVR
ncbi:hypothetical protein O3Q52_20180 [Streptomyces sp. ActVer]|uniref:hypothetical protein n=1 Tax=Streptomyces sp. ActVer TaxID=3014558 RepID=UPI0022B409C5|nr:hypothetical protein [Streptomyces sp. ActVer]MCZ4510466.1 hypothetical protein [Streptomyces sp. ActVer]